MSPDDGDNINKDNYDNNKNNISSDFEDYCDCKYSTNKYAHICT